MVRKLGHLTVDFPTAMPFLWVDCLRHIRKSIRVTFPNSEEMGVASSSSNSLRRASKLGSRVLSYSMLLLPVLTAATVWLLELRVVSKRSRVRLAV